jgi:hypothetical protein
MFYNTLIKYYIGLHYANENSFEEAYVILNRVQHVDIEETIEFAKRNNLQKGVLIKKDLEELEEVLLPNLSYLLCKSHAKILEKQSESQLKKLQGAADNKVDSAGDAVMQTENK